MGTGTLTIDLAAIVANWRALAALARVETAAVVKADAYGLGAGPVAAQARRGRRRRFFVAMAEEGLRSAARSGPGPRSWSSPATWTGDARAIAELGADAAPQLGGPALAAPRVAARPPLRHPARHRHEPPRPRVGRMGGGGRDRARPGPVLLMSHLACADEPDHPMNPYQLDLFRQMTDGLGVPRSLAATGGILLGPDYHFDLVRPGIGLYGGLPFDHARPVVRLDLPVIQVRDLAGGRGRGLRQRLAGAAPLAPRHGRGGLRRRPPARRCRTGSRSGRATCPARRSAASRWTSSSST